MVETQHEVIRRIVTDLGIWGEGREMSHKFILSPEVYPFTEDEYSQLKTIGQSLYVVMQGMSQIVAFSEDQRIAKGRVWDIIRRVTKIGIPRYHRRLQVQFPEQYPILFKVDMLRSEGKFWIVELDGVNTHGFGYTVLLNSIRDALTSRASRRLTGIAATIVRHMREHWREEELFCFVSGNSRFYDPYYRLLMRELEHSGISTTYCGEWWAEHGEKLKEWHHVALQFPIFRGGSDLQKIFTERCEHGDLVFLIPPKTFMGSKAVFALLKNSVGDENVEAVLRQYIGGDSLDTLRSFMPATYLVYPEGERAVTNALREREGVNWVLKQAISSGMKGTKLSLNIAPDAFPYWQPHQTILQEELENDPLALTFYDEEGNMRIGTWFARFTAHFHFDELADMDVTARQDKLVHGASDCLMFGATLP
ncbi:MAG: hypothetical protein HYW91_01460 [Candidatus Sungbacteria bacterium]|nr:hypothetical protein [Candidatus Sungbacteria bacterium]